MNNLRKAIALLLSLCLMTGAALSLAESAAPTETVAAATAEPAATEVTEAVPVATVQLAATDVVARVNGTDVLWGDVEP